MARSAVLLDDRLLIEELLVGLPWGRRAPEIHTTPYWYYRACRAAVAGAGGHLSGPFEHLPSEEQGHAILSLLELRGDIGLPEPVLVREIRLSRAVSRTRMGRAFAYVSG